MWGAFLLKTFDVAFSTAIFIKEKAHQTADEHIRHPKAKQQRDYNGRHQVSNKIKLS